MSKLTFSGHESFPCRQFWLKKGYDFLRKKHAFSDPDAVVHLGVGRNMVNSIYFWLKSFALINEAGTPNPLADYLLVDDGRDPYLEKTGTLWLLHYLLIKHGRASLYDIVFNDLQRVQVVFTKPQLTDFVIKYCKSKDVSISHDSIHRDVEVLIRSYTQPQRKSRFPEDDYTTLLMDLDLLSTLESTKQDGGTRYAIERRTRRTLPSEIVLYAILERYQGNSVAFRDLANDRNGPGMIFALSDDGLLNQINEMTKKDPRIVYTDVAGVRELQFLDRPKSQLVLDAYYGA